MCCQMVMLYVVVLSNCNDILVVLSNHNTTCGCIIV